MPRRLKIPDADIPKIKQAVYAGAKLTDLAKQYGVHLSLISLIVQGFRRTGAK